MTPPILAAGHLRQLPHTPAPATEIRDVGAVKKGVPVILPAPVYNLLTGDVRTSCRWRRSKLSVVSWCRPVF